MVELTERLIAADQSHPAALIVSAWRELERALQETVRRRGRASGPEDSAATLAERLASDGAIGREGAAEVRRLAEGRNRVVHAEGLPPTSQQAFAFAGEVQHAIVTLTP